MAFLVLILCYCLVQFGQGALTELNSDAQSILNETRKINDAVENFVEDIHDILKKYQNNTFVVENLKRFVSNI